MIKQSKKAFTLVELIVVITILAILGTIAFISLQGYSKQARDSRRISDVSNIKKSLELFQLNTGKYPVPDNKGDVLYDGDVLWTQGTIGDNVTQNLSKNIQEKPIDPLHGIEYMYSVLDNKKEYQILVVYEGEFAFGSKRFTSEANASNNVIKITGNFNEIYAKNADYIVPTPSIFMSEDLPIDLLSSQQSIRSIVLEGGNNIPKLNIPGLTQSTGGLNINFAVTQIATKSSEDFEKIQFINTIQSAYSGSELKNDGLYKQILLQNTDEKKLTLFDNITNNKTKKVISDTITQNFTFNEASDWIIEDNTRLGIQDNNLSLSLYNMNEKLSTGGIPTCFATQNGSCSNLYNGVGGDPVPQWRVSGPTSGWFEYSWGDSKIVNKIKIWSLYNRGVEAIKDFRVSGSNDGTNWTDLYTGLHPNDTTNGFVEYSFTNNDSYNRYRLNVDSIYPGNGGNNMGMSEIEFWGMLNGVYSTTPYYFTTSDTNNIDLTGKTKIYSVNINSTIPDGTNLKFLVSFDGRNSWKKWDGSSWISHAGGLGDLQNGNTIEDFKNGLENYVLSDESSLDFAVDLSTSDISKTPEISGININFK